MDSNITPIGITNYRNTNQRFGIRDKGRLQHLYVIGKSGTGKSTYTSMPQIWIRPLALTHSKQCTLSTMTLWPLV